MLEESGVDMTNKQLTSILPSMLKNTMEAATPELPAPLLKWET
jgi:hypothetical protein